MKKEAYESWLKGHITYAPMKDYTSRCGRIEDELGINLDEEYDNDCGKALIDKLAYTAADERNHRPLGCKIHFSEGANLRSGMASLRSAARQYFRFRFETEN